MKNVKAEIVLPEALLEEIQQYVQGENLYIPKPKHTYRKWGTCNGGRKEIDDRNMKMIQAYRQGSSISKLADEYYLSVETVKKIVYGNR